jgi:hypothetical protein
MPYKGLESLMQKTHEKCVKDWIAGLSRTREAWHGLSVSDQPQVIHRTWTTGLKLLDGKVVIVTG